MAEDNDRRLTGMDFFLLWAGAAVSLAEIWAGGLVVPLGFVGGLAAILMGHVIGNTFLGLGGIMGSRERVPTMVGLRPSFGLRGSYIPSILNVVQLIGWTAVMLVICGQAAYALTRRSLLGTPGHWIVLCGTVTTLWAMVGHRYWRWLHRISVTALLGLCAVLTWVLLSRYPIGSQIRLSSTKGLSFMLGVDLVVAMPISWMPLVSDYSRFAISDRGSFWGTWWGYFIVSSWMYAIGLMAALATRAADPSEIVLKVMADYGLVLPALAVVVFSTVTTTFLDIYSTAVSWLNIFPRMNEKWVTAMGGLMGTLLALLFPMTQYENFLLLIGAFFCPIFGIVLVDYYLLRRGYHGRYGQWGVQDPAVRYTAIGASIAGFVLYQWSYHEAWSMGSSLPSMILAGGIYWALERMPFPTFRQ